MNQIKRTVHAFFLPGLDPARLKSWQPAVDVYRLPDGWIIKFELAGVAPEDVTVTVRGNHLILQGMRLDHCLVPGCSLHQMEIAYNQFERSIELPEKIDQTTMECEFVHGMLLVRIRQVSPR